jgi:hypothetical protein
LDYTDTKNPDHFFLPLVFLESYSSPAAVLTVGKTIVQVPLDWSILVCDAEYSDLEVVPITALNDRGFYTFVYNPLKHMFPKPEEVIITNIYSEIKWFFPKMKNANVLVMPIQETVAPNCILIVKEANKLPETMDIGSILE